MIFNLKNIFNIIKKQSVQEVAETEFSFIWYKKLQAKDKTFYTQPFRTKIKAKNRNEAIEKLTSQVLGRMKLMIVDETDFHKTDLSKFQKSFDDISKNMEEMISKFNLYERQ